MASNIQQRIRYLPLRSVLGTSLANPALWYEIGDALEDSCRLVKFDNLTNQNVLISANGVDAFTIIPTGGFLLLDITANKSNIDGLFVDAFTQYYAKAAVAPTSGSVYVTALSTRS